MNGRARRWLGLFALVALMWLAGCSYAVPDVCGVACDAGVVAANQGYNVTAEHARLTIEVRPDGSAHWTARLDLTGPGVSRLQADPAAVRSILRSTMAETGFSAAPANPRNLTARLHGRTLVIAFDDPGLGHRSVGGVIVVDRFNREAVGDLGGYEVDVDEVVLRGPDGTVVANRPPNGDRHGSSVTYREYVARKTYVVFAPDRSGLWRGAVTLAVVLEVLGWALVPTVVGTVATSTVLVGTAVVLLYGRETDWDPYADLRTGRWRALGVLAGLAAVTVALTNGSPTVGDVDLIGWLFLMSPMVVLGGLGASSHRGPSVRAVGLAALAGLAGAGSFGTALSVGTEPVAVVVYTGIWAVGNVVLGAALFVGLRRYVRFLDDLD